MQNKVRSNSKVAQAPSTAIAAPLPLGGRLILTATIRQHSVGRGFEEVHERSGHKPKSAPHKRRAKTPLHRTKQGSTLFALPSEGSNPSCWGVFGGRGGLFSKSPPQKSRVPHKKPCFLTVPRRRSRWGGEMQNRRVALQRADPFVLLFSFGREVLFTSPRRWP